MVLCCRTSWDKRLIADISINCFCDALPPTENPLDLHAAVSALLFDSCWKKSKYAFAVARAILSVGKPSCSPFDFSISQTSNQQSIYDCTESLNQKWSIVSILKAKMKQNLQGGSRNYLKSFCFEPISAKLNPSDVQFYLLHIDNSALLWIRSDFS